MKKTQYTTNKIPLIKILDLYKALSDLLYQNDGDRVKELKYPAKVSYAINKNLSALIPFVAEFEAEKQKIVEKFGGKPDQEAKIYVYETPEQEQQCNAEITTLVYAEKDLDIHKITLDMLGEAMISPEKINALEELGFLVIE